MDTTPDASPSAENAEDSHRTKGLLRLTMACNERCPFCNVPVEDYPRPTPPQEETDTEIDAFIASGEQTMTISGGEPTLLRKRLIAAIRRAREGGISFVELQTNAILIDESYASDLAQAGLTSAFVSLLSHIPAHHDVLAGLDGAFEPCLAGIDALLATGIRVALNPVTARQTQTLIADYVDFVANRLPGVRSISMSAVQPHGRAAHDLDLLPEYDILEASIREARSRARHHDIDLLNPYCGLPLCIGWDDGLDASVEAIESAQGGWRETPGLDNRGNKSHGEPCRQCALRSRCGGAWHAYWAYRDGAGIEAPLVSQSPWTAGSDPVPGQTLVEVRGTPSDHHWEAINTTGEPTVWLRLDTLDTATVTRILSSRCTDLALDIDLSVPTSVQTDLQAIRRLVRATSLSSPQHRVQVHLAWTPGDATAQTVADAVAVAEKVGATSLTLIEALGGRGEDRARRAAQRCETLRVVLS